MKASSPISLTPSGMTSFLIDLQERKASSPIEVSVEGRVTDDREVQT